MSTHCSCSKDDHDDPDKETKEGATGTSASAKDKEPSKRYRLTDKMKLIFWQLYCLSNECSRLTNEKKSVFILFFNYIF